jgi:hypothetical protein
MSVIPSRLLGRLISTIMIHLALSLARFGRIDEWHLDFRNILSYSTLWKILRLVSKYNIICYIMSGHGVLEKMASDVT